jgi:hypothetical protein
MKTGSTMAENSQSNQVREFQLALTNMQVEVSSVKDSMTQLQKELVKQMQEMFAAANKNKNSTDQYAGQLHRDNGEQSGQEGTSSGDAFRPRTMRFEFPRFDGDDPERCCYKATQFFEYYATPEQQKFNISAFYMEGKALIWFQELHSSNNLRSWADFLKAIRVRFGKGSYDDPMETLTKLQQVGLLEDYKSQFEVLANRVHDLPKHHQLSCFLGGFRHEIRFTVFFFFLISRNQIHCSNV